MIAVMINDVTIHFTETESVFYNTSTSNQLLPIKSLYNNVHNEMKASLN